MTTERVDPVRAQERDGGVGPHGQRTRSMVLLLITGILVISVLASTRGASTKNSREEPATPRASTGGSESQGSSALGAPSVTIPDLPTNPDSPSSGTTVLDIAGTGSTTTKLFHVGGAWDLIWAYECSGADDGSLTVTTKGADGLSPVEAVGPKGAGSEHYDRGGDFQLQISSQCPWVVRVKS